MKRTGLIVILMVIAMVWLTGPVAANPSSANLFKAMDKNGDGKLTSAEYMAGCKQAKKLCLEEFKWFDRNKDGHVTLMEFEGKVK